MAAGEGAAYRNYVTPSGAAAIPESCPLIEATRLPLQDRLPLPQYPRIVQ